MPHASPSRTGRRFAGVTPSLYVVLYGAVNGRTNTGTITAPLKQPLFERLCIVRQVVAADFPSRRRGAGPANRNGAAPKGQSGKERIEAPRRAGHCRQRSLSLGRHVSARRIRGLGLRSRVEKVTAVFENTVALIVQIRTRIPAVEAVQNVLSSPDRHQLETHCERRTVPAVSFKNPILPVGMVAPALQRRVHTLPEAYESIPNLDTCHPFCCSLLLVLCSLNNRR